MLMIVIMTIIKIITTTNLVSFSIVAILTTTKTYDNYVCFRGTINLTFSRVDHFSWVAVDAGDS